MTHIMVISLILSVSIPINGEDSTESFFLDLKEMNQLNKQLNLTIKEMSQLNQQLSQELEESKQLNIQLRQDMDVMNTSLTMLLDLQNGKLLSFVISS